MRFHRQFRTNVFFIKIPTVFNTITRFFVTMLLLTGVVCTHWAQFVWSTVCWNTYTLFLLCIRLVMIIISSVCLTCLIVKMPDPQSRWHSPSFWLRADSPNLFFIRTLIDYYLFASTRSRCFVSISSHSWIKLILIQLYSYFLLTFSTSKLIIPFYFENDSSSSLCRFHLL